MRFIYLALFTMFVALLALAIAFSDSDESTHISPALSQAPMPDPCPEIVVEAEAPPPPIVPITLDCPPSAEVARSNQQPEPRDLQVDLGESCDEAMSEGYRNLESKLAREVQSRTDAEHERAESDALLARLREQLARLKRENTALQTALAAEQKELAFIRERLLRGRGVALN